MSNQWADLSWTKLQERALDAPIVFVPASCVEAQGPYSPLGLEARLTDRLARDSAVAVNGLALPGVSFGNSHLFASTPGTILIQPETLTGVYRDVLRSVVRAGMTRILGVVCHNTNQQLFEYAAISIREETGIAVAWFDPGRRAATHLQAIVPNFARIRGHGSDPGLSLARYLYGDLVESPTLHEPESPVATGAVQVDGATLDVDGIPVGLPLAWSERYPLTGAFGDPTLSTAEIGEAIYNRLLDDILQICQGLWPSTP